MKLDSIKKAVETLQAGKLILVMDDEDRENEGDLICAAEYATTENVNFMASFAKGLICMPMSREIAERLMLPPMVEKNSDNHDTAFTVSIDHKDTTTGIALSRLTGLPCFRPERAVLLSVSCMTSAVNEDAP